MDEVDYAIYDQVVEQLESVKGDFYNPDDLKDAVVDIFKSCTHYTDEQLEDIAEYLYAMDRAILTGA